MTLSGYKNDRDSGGYYVRRQGYTTGLGAYTWGFGAVGCWGSEAVALGWKIPSHSPWARALEAGLGDI